MEKLVLPGFPEEVSEPIELPNIGELLMYPVFQGILIEDFMRQATEFQKYMVNKMTLRNDKKYVTVMSSVSLLEPNARSHVHAGRSNMKDCGWHMDGDDRQLDKWAERTETCHILSSACGAMTEFSKYPLEMDLIDGETKANFMQHLNCNWKLWGITPQAIEPGRIYTFENHLHRAVEPQKVEFRYFLRVRETDYEGAVFSTAPYPIVGIQYVDEGVDQPNMYINRRRVTIMKPRCLL